MGSSMDVRKSKLTETAVAALKPAAREYEVHDTLRDGLRLRVNPGGTKSWTLFYHRDGRNRRIGLGRYPWVSLSRARERAAEALGAMRQAARKAASDLTPLLKDKSPPASARYQRPASRQP